MHESWFMPYAPSEAASQQEAFAALGQCLHRSVVEAAQLLDVIAFRFLLFGRVFLRSTSTHFLHCAALDALRVQHRSLV